MYERLTILYTNSVYEMSSQMVRIPATAHRALRELAKRTGEPMQTVLAKAIEEYRRRKFLEDANTAFGTLRKNARAWKQEQQEREDWDLTVGDGLEQD